MKEVYLKTDHRVLEWRGREIKQGNGEKQNVGVPLNWPHCVGLTPGSISEQPPEVSIRTIHSGEERGKHVSFGSDLQLIKGKLKDDNFPVVPDCMYMDTKGFFMALPWYSIRESRSRHDRHLKQAQVRCCRWHLCQAVQEEVGLVAVAVTRVRSGMRRFKMAYGRCLITFSSLRLLIWTSKRVQVIKIKFKPL